MSVKLDKALRATNNSIVSNPAGHYTLNGRVYNSEKYAGPLEIRKDAIRIAAHNERVSATDIYNMERFLEGHKGRLYARDMSKETREQIVVKYDLQFNARAHRWMGDEVAIFNKLCEQYPHAAKYKKYKGLLYAINYGDTPCTVYKEGD